MELYLSLTVRLWSCAPIILTLPLSLWWSPPSPRLQPARGLEEPDESGQGSASDCTQVCASLQEEEERDQCGRILDCRKVLQSCPPASTLSACLSVALCHSLPVFLIASAPSIRGGLWKTACHHCARDAAHQFGSGHPAAQSIRHWQRAAVQLPFCE